MRVFCAEVRLFLKNWLKKGDNNAISGFLKREDLFRHGTVMLIASNISFFFGYLFHLYVARVLGPEDYGVLGVLLGMLYIFSVPTQTIALIATGYTSIYNSKGMKSGIIALLHSFLKKLSILAVFILFFILLFSHWIAEFLRLSSPVPIIFLGLTIVFSLILSVTRGILRGLQNFGQLAWNVGLERIALLVMGIILIALGFGVNGAVLAYGLASIAMLLLSFIQLRTYMSKAGEKIDSFDFYRYSLPIFLTFLFITLIESVDVIAVKRFFTSEETGYFTATKMIGQVIFFASLNIAGVLFPKASELYMKNMDGKKQLKKALLYFSIIAVIAIITSALFSEEILSLLFGYQYAVAKILLLPYVLSMSILSLSVIILHYNLAVSNLKYIIPLIFLSAVEICLLAIFHDSMIQIIYAVLATSLALLFFNLYSYFKIMRGQL